MVELDFSGFVFDKHPMALENLDSKIANGIIKLIPTELKRRINFLGETQSQYKTTCPKANRQANHVSNIIFFQQQQKLRGHTSNLNDFAPCRVVQRPPRDVQSDSERNIVSPLVRIRMKVYLENLIREASGKSLAS